MVIAQPFQKKPHQKVTGLTELLTCPRCSWGTNLCTKVHDGYPLAKDYRAKANHWTDIDIDSFKNRFVLHCRQSFISIWTVLDDNEDGFSAKPIRVITYIWFCMWNYFTCILYCKQSYTLIKQNPTTYSFEISWGHVITWAPQVTKYKH